jgi:hypothetical protein
MTRKIILAVVAISMMAAIPAMAQTLPGVWKGTGDGVCPPPWPTPLPVMMNPWQNWKGEIPATGNAFKGTWHDNPGYHGNFKGTILLSTPTYALCNGQWTAINDQVVPPVEYVVGNFTMRFYYADLTCDGEWYSSINVYHGTMKGAKVSTD